MYISGVLEQERIAFAQVARHREGSAEAREHNYRKYLQTLHKDDVVLDIGCGDGLWLRLCAEAGIAARGFDTDDAMIKKLQKEGHSVYTAYGPEPWPADATVVTAFHVIEHNDPVVVFHWLWSSPKSVQGWGIITPNLANTEQQVNFWQDPTHIRPYPPELIEAFCKKAGFLYTDVSFDGHGMDTVVWAWRTPWEA